MMFLTDIIEIDIGIYVVLKNMIYILPTRNIQTKNMNQLPIILNTTRGMKQYLLLFAPGSRIFFSLQNNQTRS